MMPILYERINIFKLFKGQYTREEQKLKYLPGCVTGDIITAIGMTEPNAGSDLAAIRTTAVESGNEIVITGQKTLISNGINCDLIILAARDPDEKTPTAPLISIW